jgi:hypothetical protein
MITETRIETKTIVTIKAEGSAIEVGKWFLTMTPQDGKWIGATFKRRDEGARATVIFHRSGEQDGEGSDLSIDARTD